MKIISGFEEWARAAEAARKPWQKNHIAMYTSEFDAIVLDPQLWRIPLDDHLVHRGDGVFEMFKCENRAAYNMEAHLARLVHSARSIGLEWKKGGIDDIREKTIAAMKAAGRDRQYVRVMLSRGPGSFAVNPYDCPEPSLYVMVYAWHEPFMTLHPEGAKTCRSDVRVKEPRYATRKSGNYLPNVMMKKEAVERGCDFAVAFDDAGHMAEGATENFGIVSAAGELLFPDLSGILSGTTMLRTMELAEKLVADGTLAAVRHADITEADVEAAREITVVGSTLDVAAGVTWNGRPVGDGKPGPVALALNALLHEDIQSNAALRTAY